MAGYNQQLKFNSQGHLLTLTQDVEEITVKEESTLSVPITNGLAAPVGASFVQVQVQGGGIRYKIKAPAVAPTTGWIAVEGTILELTAGEAQFFSAIVSSGTPQLAVRWF